MHSAKTTYFLWADLEMTGLDLNEDTILEVGAILTREDLTVVSEFERLVHCGSAEDIHANLSEWCQDQFRRNGLLRDLDALHHSPKRTAHSLSQVEKDMAQWLDAAAVPESDGFGGTTTPCIMLGGTSVHCDFWFLRMKMPEVSRRLSHQVMDLTTLLKLFQLWGNMQIPNLRDNRQGRDHRALDDCQTALNIARFFMDAIKRSGSPGGFDRPLFGPRKNRRSPRQRAERSWPRAASPHGGGVQDNWRHGWGFAAMATPIEAASLKC